MSERAVKEERRALRRVVGPKVEAVVQDHHQAIQVLVQHVARLEQRNRGFWRRLRWLVVGV